jgi:hypothetical protein
MKAPDPPEAMSFESRCQFLLIEHGMVALPGFGRQTEAR